MNITPELKNFMNTLWGNKGFVIPNVGVITGTRAKAGIDIEVTVDTGDGDFNLLSGLELFEKNPNLFQKNT